MAADFSPTPEMTEEEPSSSTGFWSVMLELTSALPAAASSLKLRLLSSQSEAAAVVDASRPNSSVKRANAFLALASATEDLTAETLATRLHAAETEIINANLISTSAPAANVS